MVNKCILIIVSHLNKAIPVSFMLKPQPNSGLCALPLKTTGSQAHPHAALTRWLEKIRSLPDPFLENIIIIIVVRNFHDMLKMIYSQLKLRLSGFKDYSNINYSKDLSRPRKPQILITHEKIPAIQYVVTNCMFYNWT